MTDTSFFQAGFARVAHDQLIQEHSVALALAIAAPGSNLDTP